MMMAEKVALLEFERLRQEYAVQDARGIPTSVHERLVELGSARSGEIAAGARRSAAWQMENSLARFCWRLT